MNEAGAAPVRLDKCKFDFLSLIPRALSNKLKAVGNN
jgi:hypothetical protein